MAFFNVVVYLLSVSNGSIPRVSCYSFQDIPKVSVKILGGLSFAKESFLTAQVVVLLRDV